MTGGSPAGRKMAAFCDIWIHRVGENTSDIRVGTLRTVTACYRLVARRILPRQVPVAWHFKVVVPGVRDDK